MAKKYKVLIADNLAEEGVKILEDSGLFEVDYRKKTPRDEFLKIISNYQGLIIRSATKADAEAIEKAKKLKVIIRAGVGVDNIDIPACSQKGIIVMNAPSGNSISTAEQAIALMFAVARKTPLANASMKEKKWEKSKFTGTQLTGKTMGVIGLGRIGREVVKRAQGLQMKVLGYDPYIPAENIKDPLLEIVTIEKLLQKSDFISVHTPLTATTKHIINMKNVNKLKKGVYVINCARGGIYEEKAVIKGLEDGIIAGAAFDVYTQEPPLENNILYSHEKCIMTPHLGASTKEAQIEVAKETASSMVAYFKDGVSRNSFNYPALDPSEMDILSSWLELSEKLGSFTSQISKSRIKKIDINFFGEITSLDLTPVEIYFTKGFVQTMTKNDVNLVNASVLVQERGVKINSKNKSTDGSNIIEVVIKNEAKETITIKATLNYSGGTIIRINNYSVEFIPQGNVLIVQNKDVPKVVGELGAILGNAKINIASLDLSRDKKGGTALTVINTDEMVSDKIISQIEKRDFIIDVKSIHL